MSVRWGELVTADKSTVVSKSSLDVIVVEDGQSDGRFPDPAWTDQSEWSEVFSETNDSLNQIVAPETGPWWRGRQFSRRYATRK